MRLGKAKKAVAFLLTALMVIGVIPAMDKGVQEAKAADNVHVLEASALTAAAAGTYTNGQEVKVDDYFTLYMSEKTKIDSSEKTWDDGYTSGQRINFGGKADVSAMKNFVAFKTDGAATVKLWWVEGGEDHRELVIYKPDGTEAAKTTEGAAAEKNGLCMSKLSVAEGGTYFLGGDIGNNYIFKVEVTEEAAVAAAPSEYVLEASALTAAAAGTYTNGQEVKVDDYFTLYMSEKTKIDSSEKTWDDGYTSGQRINFGGKADVSAMKNLVSFKTSAAAKVKLWWVEGGEDHRELVIYNPDGTEAAKTTEGVAAEKNGLCMSTLSLSAAGNYLLGGDIGNNYIFKIEVVEEAAAAAASEYVLEASALTAAAAGTYTNGQEVKVDDYFALYMSEKTKIDSSEKTWDDGYTSGQRINFGGKADVSAMKNLVSFKTGGAATVKLWWVEGGEDHRELVIYKPDGTEAAKTTEGAAAEKNGLCMSTLSLSEAGSYLLGGDIGNNYIFKIQVTEAGGSVAAPKKAWSEVAAPVLGTPVLKEGSAGTIVIPYTMLIDENDGAEYVEITVKNAAGEVLSTLKSMVPGAEGTKEFTPSESGNYTFEIAAYREGEDAKAAAKSVTMEGFALPLTTSTIGTIYNKGNGTVSLAWSAVKEATAYDVEYSTDGSAWTTVAANDALTLEVSGLTVDAEYFFRVVAKRGEDSTVSANADIKVTAEEQVAWGYIVYGNGASTSNSSVSGSLNEDGKIQLTSGKLTDGKLTGSGNNGKLVPASYDGLQFYYTTVPSNKNFTLRAKVTVDQWWLSNGQEGFGLMAADQLGGSGWNNSYMAVVSKTEYYWNDNTLKVTTDTGAKKVSQKLGIAAQEKVGITKDNLALFEANDTTTIQKEFSSTMYGLEQRYPDATNVIGNGINVVTEDFYYVDGEESIKGELITEMYLTIQKNNTGYFVTYETADGSYSVTKKYYDPDALSKIDPENVYVGFFAARYAQITVSDVTFTTTDPANDAPAEEKPIEKIAVNTKFQSPAATGHKDYTLKFYANCDGVASVNDSYGNKLAENVAVKAETTVTLCTSELQIGNNAFVVTFTPDENYVPGEDQIMESYRSQKLSHTVTHKIYGEAGQSLWVAPGAYGLGTKDSPMSIYEAVKYVQPGQTIVLMEGTYSLNQPLKIERGIDGTAENKIYMVADPEAATRPVLNFGKICTGMTLGGNYWVLRGFDVTKSADAQKGLQISGSYNLVDSVNAYYNGNTGIQISRYSSTDLYEEWPSYNTILNCTSYGNADAGFEDADGFAAKLTIGDGNVFDGCIAHHNADDGWDLYAKVQTGAIGSVTIKNCVAYANGYLEDGTLAGNGNGFKLGGESISGKHVLENCLVYDNKNKGIDSNSCPDIIVKNCITFNNGAYNVAFYTNTAANTDFSAEGVISFRYSDTEENYDVAETIKLAGTQDEAKVYGATNYYWNTGLKQAVNNKNEAVSADWFESLDTSVVPGRNSDGTIDMNGLLKLTDKAAAEVKAAGLGAGIATETSDIPASIILEGINNGEELTPTPVPTEAPTATPTPEATPTEAPTATPVPEATPTVAPEATPTTAAEEVSKDDTKDDDKKEEKSNVGVYVAIAIAAVVVIAGAVVVVMKKKGSKSATPAENAEKKDE
ncbi:MAG: right-handed parallel beta-helix repeat-containing protein [Lachnospiraceae bacterium]|nr:right-handed parallel beta-helix repeat-containing protein [Lachnospiraceae bacterium]